MKDAFLKKIGAMDKALQSLNKTNIKQKYGIK